MSVIATSVPWLGSVLIVASTAYAWLALLAVSRSTPRASYKTPTPIPISVLKPLCGAEPRLYENLRSFCQQRYPTFQLLFGIRDPGDPAIKVVRRLKREFPALDLQLVVDPRVHGCNLKVSNLINLASAANHPWLVLADSDIEVPPDYLRRVTTPLADADIGIVTCIYRGRPCGGLWARLGSLFIDDWFAPSVRLAQWFGAQCFGFGATIAMRRDTLQRIGGLEAIRDVLADDYWLGELSRRLRLRSVLSEVVVNTDVTECSLAQLWAHEVRWLSTIRALAPAGFAFSFLCFTLPVLGLGLLLAHNHWQVSIALSGVLARLLVHDRQHRGQPHGKFELLLVPLRDGLSLLEWAAALIQRQVQWRGQAMGVKDRDPAARP